MTNFKQDSHSSGKSPHRSFNRGQDKTNSAYVGAPYNFIDFPRYWLARYEGLDRLPPHDCYGDGLLSGSIELEWEAETPVYIGNGGQGGFFYNHNGFAIPGSSVRGMIRSHIQILGMSNYRDDIEDRWFLYRDMASKNHRLKNEYRASLGLVTYNKQIAQQQERGSLPDRLKAGHIEKGENGKYYIFPAQQDDSGAQIYRVPERHLKEMQLPPEQVKLMYKKEFWGKEIEKLTPKEINKEYTNKEYEPYYTPVYFAMDPAKGKVGKIVLREANLAGTTMHEGYLLSSGYMSAGTDPRTRQTKPGKLTHYIIRAAEENTLGQEIDMALIDAYNTDLIRKKYKGNERLDKKYKFYHLPKETGLRKPIFYVETEGKITYFGFTPHLRVFYDYSLYQGIPQEFRSEHLLDYSKSLFGFSSFHSPHKGKSTESDGIQAYKSRLSFEDMQAVGDPREMSPVRLILAEPKATAYPLYLKQPDFSERGELITYNNPTFQIKGIKRYWFKKEESLDLDQKEKKNDNIASYICPLPKGTCFHGRIRFFNLAEDELGLLLWAIMLEPESKVQIGMGKPYGYGRMKLRQEKLFLKIEDLSTKYSERLTFAADYKKNCSPEKYIQTYWKHVQTNYQIDIRQEPHIQSFFQMTNTIMTNEQVRYMEIDRQVSEKTRNNEYKYLQPLGSVEDVIEGRITQRQVMRNSKQSSGSYRALEYEKRNRNSPTKSEPGRKTSGTKDNNKLQTEDLPPWKLKLQSLDIKDTD